MLQYVQPWFAVFEERFSWELWMRISAVFLVKYLRIRPKLRSDEQVALDMEVIWFSIVNEVSKQIVRQLLWRVMQVLYFINSFGTRYFSLNFQ